MGHAAGLAYTDTDVKADEHYLYELRAVLADGPTRSSSPSTCRCGPGTSSFPTRRRGSAPRRATAVPWCSGTATRYAATYVVQRSTSPGGPFQRSTRSRSPTTSTTDIDGQPLPAPQPGLPRRRRVGRRRAADQPRCRGRTVYGPDNGVTYWYRSPHATPSTAPGRGRRPVAATPLRSIPPMAPGRAAGVADDDGRRAGRHLAQGHAQRREPPAARRRRQTNYVYRAETREAARGPRDPRRHLVATIASNPLGRRRRPLVTWTDTDPALVPPYGTKPFFYRVVRRPTPSATSARRPPSSAARPRHHRRRDPPSWSAANGAADHIRVEWKPNPEPDVAGYQIYRGVCDHGFLYVPGIIHKKDKEGGSPPRARAATTAT